MTIRVLIAEDDDLIAPGLKRTVSRWGCDVTIIARAEDHPTPARSEEYDLVVADIWLAGSETGLELVRRMRRGGSTARFVLMSGTIEGVSDEPATTFLNKPFHISVLKTIIDEVIKEKSDASEEE